MKKVILNFKDAELTFVWENISIVGLISLAKEGGFFCIPPAGRAEEEERPRGANVPPPPPP